MVCAALTLAVAGSTVGCGELFGGTGGNYGNRGADIVDPAYGQSGARLIARTIGAGPAHHLVDFLDLVTGQACTFRDTGPHGLRCVPRRESQLIFGDPDCRSAFTESVGPFITVAEGVAHVGEVPRELATAWVRTGDGCAAVGPRGGLFPVRELLSFETMVHGIVHHADAADQRLTRVGILAQDGAWQPSGWFDRQLGFHCAVDSDGDLAGKCLPDARVSLSQTTSTCGVRPVATVTTPHTDWVTTYRYLDAAIGSCEPRFEVSVRALGAETTPQLSGETASCSGLVTGGGGPGVRVPDPTWLVGEPLPASALADLAAGTGAAEPTSGLALRGLVAPDGRFGVPAIWPLRPLPGGTTSLLQHVPWPYFEVAGQTCQPLSVGGALRCATVTAHGALFGDDTCSTPVLRGRADGVGIVAVLALGRDELPVPEVDQLYEVGPARDSRVVFTERSGACVAAGGDHPCAMPVHERGAPLDPDTFPALTVELR